ncbi:MAG: hypothetical protein R3236_05180, partial [Phycisphaeraceae bacterium]|nr:hypothetical protein [Phycisphaeraceae bacterium]
KKAASLRKQIADLTIEYKAMWRGVWGEYQKKNRIAAKKSSALKKQRYTEHVLERVKKGRPVAFSTMDKIMKVAGVNGSSKGHRGARHRPRRRK